MRTSIIVFRNHGDKAFQLLAGPDVPIDVQVKEFNEALLLGNSHPEIAEVQRWDSDSGIFRTLKFAQPSEAAAAQKKIEDDMAAHLEAQKPKRGGKAAKVEAPKVEEDAAPVTPPTDL